jgi:DNA-binding transcriptional regulator YhcF (GntR family)
MQLQISKDSEVPLRQQLIEQVIYHITTNQLRPEQPLPSVRELARRLKIHHNTVSEAYQELVRRRWLTRHRGSRLAVRCQEAPPQRGSEDIDDFINAAVRLGRERGYSLQSLRERVRTRLMDASPDHILVVEQESGLCQLLQEEIRNALAWPVRGCSVAEMVANNGLLIGALVVTPQYALATVDSRTLKSRPAIPLLFRGADEQLQAVRELREPCVIGAVSASSAFLKSCRALLASITGDRHTLVEFHWPLESADALDGIDFVLCDSLAVKSVRHRKRIHYRAIAPESLDYIASAMESYQAKAK